MKLKLFGKKQKSYSPPLIQTSRNNSHPFRALNDYLPLSNPEIMLYESIREGIPIVDSAITKTIRLVGGINISCKDKKAQKLMDYFVKNVNVSSSTKGLESFIAQYLDSMLTYGNAIGEIVLSKDKRNFLGLYIPSLKNISIKEGLRPLGVDFYVSDDTFESKKVKNKNLILFTALNPKPGEIMGVSILRSLPFLSNILFKIYNSIGTNFDRIGNVRYAVTYKPANDSLDKAYAKERATMIAKEWADGMNCSNPHEVKDFITVGDVSIKVIGADNQMIDTEIPVRQMLEQIVAKLSIPPFLLGLSWSTTERMSQQQTDILTTELEHYRHLLTPVLLKICRTYLRLNGIGEEPVITWKTISLKDEVEQAQSRYYNAQAKKLETEILQSGGETL